MAGVELNYTIDDREVQQALHRLGHFKMRAMFDEIGGYLDSETQRRFDASEDWQGNALIESDRARDEGGKTLIDFGHLRDSYTYQVFLAGDGLEWGSDMVYAAIHHFGGETGRNHATELDARPIIGINADDEEEIDAIVKDFIQRELHS